MKEEQTPSKVSKIHGTQSEVQKQLREEHNIIVVVTPFYDNDTCKIDKEDIDNDTLWSYFVWKDYKFIIDGLDFKTYEDALDQGLEHGLGLIKPDNKNKE